MPDLQQWNTGHEEVFCTINSVSASKEKKPEHKLVSKTYVVIIHTVYWSMCSFLWSEDSTSQGLFSRGTMTGVPSTKMEKRGRFHGWAMVVKPENPPQPVLLTHTNIVRVLRGLDFFIVTNHDKPIVW